MRAHLGKSIIATSIDAIVCADEQGSITLWNSAAERMFGYSKSEAIGQPLTIILRESDRAAHETGIRKFLKTGKGPLIGKITETMGRRKDGTTFFKEMSLAAEKVDGEWLFTAIMRDITGRKRAEADLLLKREQLHSLLEASRLITTSLDQVTIRKLLVDAAISLMNATQGTVGMLEDGRMIFREYRHGDQWHLMDYAFESGYGVPGHVMQTKKPYITNDAEHDAHVIPEIRQTLDFHQLIDVPILNRSGELLGCFEIHDRLDARPFDDADLNQLEGLAASATIALENAKLMSERRQAEEELQKRVSEAEESRKAMLYMLEDMNTTQRMIETSKQVWVATFDAITNLIFIHDAELRITRANLAYAEASGMAIEDIIGQEYWKVFPKGDGPMQSCRHVLQGKAEEEEEEEIKLQDGRIFLNRSYAMDRESKEGLLIHIMEDVTERKREDLELLESNEKIRSITLAAQDAVLMMDDEGKINYWNKAAEKLFGYTLPEAIGKQLHPLIVPARYHKAFHAGFKKFLKTGEGAVIGKPIELTGLHRDGTEFPLELSLAAVRLHGVWNAVGMIRDITERIRAKEELEAFTLKLLKSLEGTITSVARMVEARDPYTAGHQQRVARLAAAIALEMGLSADRIRGIELGATIHDIGKIQIPAEILSKPGKLSEIEYSLIKGHSQAGFDILKDIAFPWPVADIAHQHHERLDGSGYPQGLKGDAICQEAGIVAVADVVEAMSSHRPYRPSLGVDAALAEIESKRGLSFDAEAVDACIKLFREKRFTLESPVSA